MLRQRYQQGRPFSPVSIFIYSKYRRPIIYPLRHILATDWSIKRNASVCVLVTIYVLLLALCIETRIQGEKGQPL